MNVRIGIIYSRSPLLSFWIHPTKKKVDRNNLLSDVAKLFDQDGIETTESAVPVARFYSSFPVAEKGLLNIKDSGFSLATCNTTISKIVVRIPKAGQAIFNSGQQFSCKSIKQLKIFQQKITNHLQQLLTRKEIQNEITYKAPTGLDIQTIFANIRALEQNWDNNGAEPIDETVICNAEKIIELTTNQDFEPEIFPVNDGGIAISWGGVLANLDIRLDWTALHLGYKNISSKDVVQVISDDFNAEELSNQIKEWIANHRNEAVV